MSRDGAPDIRLLLADVDGTPVTKETLLIDRAVATSVTCSNEEDGFAEAVERFVFGTRSDAPLQPVERS